MRLQLITFLTIASSLVDSSAAAPAALVDAEHEHQLDARKIVILTRTRYHTVTRSWTRPTVALAAGGSSGTKPKVQAQGGGGGSGSSGNSGESNANQGGSGSGGNGNKGGSANTPAPKPAPAPAPTSGTSSSSGGQGNGKAPGLAINEHLGIDAKSFGGGLGWYYNWRIKSLPGMGDLEYVPMVWGTDDATGFDPNTVKGAKHILSFNEPDHKPSGGGANMPFEQAGALHKSWTSKVPSNVKIGSIACVRGGIKYFEDWLGVCGSNCRFDFIAFHFYGTELSQLKTEVESYRKFGKPLWLTEVACREYTGGKAVNCSKSKAEAFMRDMVKYFRSSEGSIVERWAWFGAVSELVRENDPNLIIDASGKANSMGKTYASL